MKDLFEMYAEIQTSNLPEDTKAYISGLIKTKSASTRSRPNTSGIVKIDVNTKQEIDRYSTKKDANLVLGKKEVATGISDAVSARNGKHYAYGFLWCHTDEWDSMTESEREIFE